MHDILGISVECYITKLCKGFTAQKHLGSRMLKDQRMEGFRIYVGAERPRALCGSYSPSWNGKRGQMGIGPKGRRAIKMGVKGTSLFLTVKRQGNLCIPSRIVVE